MLLNDFFSYKLVDKQDDKLLVDVKFNTSHDIYKGHFPELPITPGVCQVQLVQEILCDIFKCKYQLKSAKDIKFLNFIDPMKVDSLSLELTLKSKDEFELSVNALMKSDAINYLKMRSVFIK